MGEPVGAATDSQPQAEGGVYRDRLVVAISQVMQKLFSDVL